MQTFVNKHKEFVKQAMLAFVDFTFEDSDEDCNDGIHCYHLVEHIDEDFHASDMRRVVQAVDYAMTSDFPFASDQVREAIRVDYLSARAAAVC